MDRTGAILAREMAEREVKEKNLSWAKVSLAYAIGVEGTVMVKKIVGLA